MWLVENLGLAGSSSSSEWPVVGSKYGTAKLNAARRLANLEEYVGRVFAATVLAEARHWPVALRLEWTVGTVRSMRTELVVACCAHAQNVIGSETSVAAWLKVLRLLIYVALPYAKRAVGPVPRIATVRGVWSVIALVLVRIQCAAIRSWEARSTDDADTGPRLMRWNLRVLGALKLPHLRNVADEMRALLYLYDVAADAPQFQANVAEAQRIFSRLKMPDRVAQCQQRTMLIVRPAETGPVLPDGETTCAMATHPLIDVPFVPDNVAQYAKDIA